MPLLPETGRRVTGIVARAQSAGRAPSLALAVVRDRALLHFTGAGETPAAGSQDPVPARLDHQDDDRDPGDAAARRGVLRPRRPALPAPAGHAGRRHHPAPAARARLRPAARARRPVVGARPPAATSASSWPTWPSTRSPGRRSGTYHYSNLAYGLLGAVLQRVTGESWADLVGKRVLDPLGMKRTTYPPVEPYARGYVVHPLDDSLHEEPRLDSGAMAPAGQLWSTVDRHGQVGGVPGRPAPAVLSRETVDEMCAPVAISDLRPGPPGTGWAWSCMRVGERVYVGHGGSMPGYVAQLAVHRPSRTGVVAFANSYGLRGTSVRALGPGGADHGAGRRAGAARAVAPGAAPAGAAAELCGRWWWMGAEYEVAADGADLVMRPVATLGAAAVAVRPRRRADRWRGTVRHERRRGADRARDAARRGRRSSTSPRSSSAATRCTWHERSSARLGDEVDQPFHRVDQRRLDVLVAVHPRQDAPPHRRPARRRRAPRRRPPSTAARAGSPATPAGRPAPASPPATRRCTDAR